jgi:hypothetical protein
MDKTTVVEVVISSVSIVVFIMLRSFNLTIIIALGVINPLSTKSLVMSGHSVLLRGAALVPRLVSIYSAEKNGITFFLRTEMSR